jgi:hypothetical protein
MKLVNPSVLGIERLFRYSELITDCKDFKDKYTNSDPEYNGCYGCEYLDERGYIECSKKHKIKFGFIRKDENNKFVKSCLDYLDKGYYRTGSYVENGCGSCQNLASITTGKCSVKNKIRQEVYRVG